MWLHTWTQVPLCYKTNRHLQYTCVFTCLDCMPLVSKANLVPCTFLHKHMFGSSWKRRMHPQHVRGTRMAYKQPSTQVASLKDAICSVIVSTILQTLYITRHTFLRFPPIHLPKLLMYIYVCYCMKACFCYLIWRLTYFFICANKIFTTSVLTSYRTSMRVSNLKNQTAKKNVRYALQRTWRFLSLWAA